jgi:hypothetical protein
MSIATVVKKRIRYPHNGANAAAIKTCLDAIVTKVNAITTAAAGFLTADTDGRAVIETLYFDAATVADKFDAGCFAANATIRALFAAGLIDLATATSIIANNAIIPAKLAAVLCSAPTTRSGAGAVAITAPTCLFTSTGGAQALTIADGAYTGQRLTIVHIVDGGSGVITQTTGAKLAAAIATITLAAAYDTLTLEWSGALWNPIAWSGTTAIVNT